MKKYFVVSDVHGFYDEMQKALSNVCFDSDNPEHILINCGDLLDRGGQPMNCLCFVNKLYAEGRAILIRGNHEDLMEEALARGEFLSHDLHNGTAETAYDIAGYGDRVFTEFDVIDAVKNNKTYNTYIKNTIDYYETKKYIFVHSFIPLIVSGDSIPWHLRNKLYSYNEDWRIVDNKAWEQARWGNPFDIANNMLNKTGKVIVHGHFHNSYWWSKNDIGTEFGEGACFDICHHDGCIGLDACTAYTNIVNILVLNEDEL